jgi:transcriptional regulator with XRE-family HTH domain
MKFNPEQLRYAAFKTRLTSRQIAILAGISHSTVSKALRGLHEPIASNLARMCRTLNVPMELCFTPDERYPIAVLDENDQGGREKNRLEVTS